MEPQRLRVTIASARNGDGQAYQRLLEVYGPRLYGYFFRATGSCHDAEDLLGELMLRMVRTLKAYDDRGRFDQWVFRIAANMIRDRIRRRKTNPVPASLSAEDDSGNSMAEQLPGRSVRVDQNLLGAEVSLELKDALAKLDDTTRHMVLLRHYGDLSFKEIADLFQCPLGTVLARVHRGIKALKKWMGAEHEPD